MDKVEPYKEYPGNAEKTKLLTKCLYLIEYLVENRVDDLYDAFDERADMFEEIRKVFISNRKINEITAHILKMYNIEATTEGYSQMNNEDEKQQQQSQVAQNANLLDIDEGNNNNPDLLLQNEGDTKTGTGIDLLSDIFSGSSTSNMNQQSSTNVNLLDNINNTQQEKKSFGFIKQKSQPQVQQEAPKKKGFSFIKNKDTNTNINVNVNINIPTQPNNDLNSIFTQQTAPQNNIVNLVDNTNPMENIFNNQPQQFPTIDLTKIENAYKDTYKAPEQKPITNPQPNFNYNLVYQNTNALKDKKANDPFGFVDDILKSKK